MDVAPWVVGARCSSCEWTGDVTAGCPACGEPLLARYDAEPLEIPRDPDGHAAFERVLPVRISEERRVGDTPLCRSGWLAEQLGIQAAYVKDEGRNPTGHLSDRDMTTAAAAAPAGSTLALASPGRSGMAAAAAAAAADLASTVYVPSRAPFGAKALINVHGGQMRVISGRLPDAVEAFAETVSDREWIRATPADNLAALEGRMTVYYEILADLDWHVPDMLVLPVGSGVTALAVAVAAERAESSGVVDGKPTIVLAQPAGCAPIVEAVTGETDGTVPWETPDSIAGELEVPDPVGIGRLRELVAETDGDAIAVPDPATLEAALQVAETDGLEVSVAGGVALAGATEASLPPGTETVVVLTPGDARIEADVIRSHLMSKGV